MEGYNDVNLLWGAFAFHAVCMIVGVACFALARAAHPAAASPVAAPAPARSR